MLYAQVPSPTDVAEVTGKLTEYGIVSILLFILLLVLAFCASFAGAVYLQLFGAGSREGVIQKTLNKHDAFLDRLTTSIEETGKTAKSTEETNRKIESTVNKLFEFVRRTDSNVDDVIRVYRSHVRILRTMADKIGVVEQIEPHLIALEELFVTEPRNPRA